MPKSAVLGQINVYDVYVEHSALYGDSTVAIHFDLYDSIKSGNSFKAVSSGGSHDATVIVPGPGGLTLLVTGLVAGGVYSGWRRRRLVQPAWPAPSGELAVGQEVKNA